MAGKIFINYRRGDDPGNTGRLFDRLQEAFRPDQLFMDVDSMKPGVDFVKELEEQVSQCDIVLAVIGHNWIESRDETGRRQLDNPEDFVRIEIASALAQNKLVIPVLVGEARVPRSDELPEPIKPLARRHAVRLTHERFRSDVQGLVKALEQALEHTGALRRAQAEAAQQGALGGEPTQPEQNAHEHPQTLRESEERARVETDEARLAPARAPRTTREDEPSLPEQKGPARPIFSRDWRRRLILIGGALATGITGAVALWIAAAPMLSRSSSQAGAGQLTVSGPEALTFAGPEGGPFTPERSSLTLRATGSGFHWSTDVSIPQWFTVSPSQGDLAAGATTEVIVTVTPAVGGLTRGESSGQIIFRNYLSNAIIRRTINLVVQAPVAAPLSLARERALNPKDTFKECATCPEMVVVPAGTFVMGSPNSELSRATNESPQHTVTFAKPFAVAKFATTRGEFALFASDTAYNDEGGCLGLVGRAWERQPWSWRSPGFDQDDRHPVVCVDWSGAKTFAAWLSKKTGKEYRLLTEAEFEYATRAGTTTRYFFGYDEKDFCRYGNGGDETLKKSFSKTAGLPCNDGYVYTAPVGSFLPNNFGLYDIVGNAWQWVEDCYRDAYDGASSDGSAWTPSACSRRVVRGGSWYSLPENLRSASRFGYASRNRYQVGFRVARTLIP
jgi:formylglycine-generating enzyme required for sulfatase activity